MLREALQFLTNQALEAEKPHAIDVPDARVRRFAKGGNLLEIPIRPTPRDHKVYTLADFVFAANNYGASGVVWVGERNITLIVDDADRLDKITLPMVFSDVWAILNNLPDFMTQRDFVRLLRHDLRGCIPDTLLPAVSKIEVATSSGQRNEVNPGRERGSREFAAELVAAGEIPEVVTVMVSPYMTPGLVLPCPIKCGLDYTMPPAAVQFSFRPLPDETKAAIQYTLADVYQHLRDELTIPVYRGQA
jgi:hypothetical protein